MMAKKYFVIFMLLTFFGAIVIVPSMFSYPQQATAKTRTTQSHCSPETNVRKDEWAPYYEGALIDTHYHIPSPLDVSPPPESW